MKRVKQLYVSQTAYKKLKNAQSDLLNKTGNKLSLTDIADIFYFCRGSRMKIPRSKRGRNSRYVYVYAQ